jgi:tetratricopeptide (TPR) repeat protein
MKSVILDRFDLTPVAMPAHDNRPSPTGRGEALRGSFRQFQSLLVPAIILFFVFFARASLLDDANKLYGEGKLVEAIKLYKKASLTGENPALCAYNAANAYFQLDSLPRSIVYYRLCINAAPEFYKAYLNLAVVYFTLSDIGNCIVTMREGLKLEPLQQKGSLLLAAAYRKCGAIAQSITAFEDLIIAYPEMEEPYIALGEIYRDLNDQDLAIHWLESYPPSGKNGVYVALALADLYESIGNPDRALYYLNRSYDFDKSKKWTLYRIVAMQQKLGNELVALETARGGLEMFPDFSPLTVLAGTIAFSRGFLGEAEKYFINGEKLGSPEAVAGLENIRSQRKRLTEAAEVEK